MAVLDFKEIPEAHVANGLQDTFELFAREFLEFMGFKIISTPDRGADGGVDLIVEEHRHGIGGVTIVRWLVSCKHKAHSGSSVTPTVEQNIRDRLDTHNCDSFMGFYSTIPSSGLTTNLDGFKTNNNIEYLIYDKELIEGNLLRSAEGLELARRFFPKSFKEWERESPKPAKIFDGDPSLKCHVCNSEFLENEKHGIIVFWEGIDKAYKSTDRIEYIKWVCKGRCDQVMKNKITMLNPNVIDRWEDIPDVVIPTKYIQWVMSILNQQNKGVVYSDEAFDNLKTFMIRVFPHVSRHLTSDEKERIKLLRMTESYLYF